VANAHPVALARFSRPCRGRFQSGELRPPYQGRGPTLPSLTQYEMGFLAPGFGGISLSSKGFRLTRGVREAVIHQLISLSLLSLSSAGAFVACPNASDGRSPVGFLWARVLRPLSPIPHVPPPRRPTHIPVRTLAPTAPSPIHTEELNMPRANPTPVPSHHVPHHPR
jgi:hypothetical protein